MKLRNWLVIMLALMLAPAFAQDDLMDVFGEEETVTEVTAAFKATRIVLGQSIENPKNGNLNFLVQHQFGKLNQGAYELFGLDQATIRLGFEYGVNDWLGLGLGRSSLNKTFDGYTKIRLLKQKSDGMPISISYFGGIYLVSLKWEEPERENKFTSRLSYAHQLLIARKFNDKLTLQLTPSLVHRNLVETKEQENDVFLVGMGGRYKITNWISVNAEYHYILPGNTADNYANSFSIGVDLDTGGHIFQLYFSNSQGQQEPYYLAATQGKWDKGDIHFGFTINRAFVLKKPERFKDNKVYP